MDSLLSILNDRYTGSQAPFLISQTESISFSKDMLTPPNVLAAVQPGDVVALIGDFSATSLHQLIHLLERRAIIMPLTVETRAQHPYFFTTGHVTHVIEDTTLTTLEAPEPHPLITDLKHRGQAGLILFSSGTTGRPKAILHDMGHFLERYKTIRPTLKTMSFLLFDHIGGINTLLHTLFNKGQIVIPSARTPDRVWAEARDHDVELLPTTPTFLRMLLMSGAIDQTTPPALKLVTYGTERMDQPTLDQLCDKLPHVDFRQTYGMSELGILRIKSQARDSLWMAVGGEGVETKIEQDILYIRSDHAMLGYLNAPSPFDENGWYNTRDMVSVDTPWLKIIGRDSDVISVGGTKFLPSEIERIALECPGVAHAQAAGIDNPITGQHVELTIEPQDTIILNKKDIQRYLRQHLPEHQWPHKIRLGTVGINHRFKKT